jgi:hypothetical protein
VESAEKYRELARECLRWADKARDPEQHRAFMDMAKTWTRAALEFERGRIPELAERSSDQKKAS